MKSILSIITLGLCLLSPVVYSQNKAEIGLRFTPQATTFRYTSGGGILADFLKATAPYYFRVRTAQGMGILYQPYKRLSLGADLLYSLQGGGYEQRKTNVNYLKLPLWIGYNSSGRRGIIFTIQSGVELSYLLSAKVKYQDGKSTDISEYVNKTSLGIPFAMGVKFRMGHSYFVTTQLYVYSDITSIASTNSAFGVYNYIYPGIRVSIDQNLKSFKRKS